MMKKTTQILLIGLVALIAFSCNSNNQTKEESKDEGMVFARVMPNNSNSTIVTYDVTGKDTLFTYISPYDTTVFIPYTYAKTKIDTVWHRQGTVTPTNLMPMVIAGSNQTITLPLDSVILSGSASDPDGTIASYSWTKLSGGNASIVNSNQPITVVKGLAAGSYQFRLSATDNLGATASAIVSVTVNPVIIVDTSTTFTPIGFGSQAVGSNTSKVYHVTNLKSTGAGSLNYILAETNPTGYTIVFDVAGTINQSHRVYTGDHFTIAGETAPWPGITISTTGGDGLVFEGTKVHHFIVRGITAIDCSNDGIACNDGANNWVITNCTAYRNKDGNIDAATDAQYGTIQILHYWK